MNKTIEDFEDVALYDDYCEEREDIVEKLN